MDPASLPDGAPPKKNLEIVDVISTQSEHFEAHDDQLSPQTDLNTATLEERETLATPPNTDTGEETPPGNHRREPADSRTTTTSTTSSKTTPKSKPSTTPGHGCSQSSNGNASEQSATHSTDPSTTPEQSPELNLRLNAHAPPPPMYPPNMGPTRGEKTGDTQPIQQQEEEKGKPTSEDDCTVPVDDDEPEFAASLGGTCSSPEINTSPFLCGEPADFFYTFLYDDEWDKDAEDEDVEARTRDVLDLPTPEHWDLHRRRSSGPSTPSTSPQSSPHYITSTHNSPSPKESFYTHYQHTSPYYTTEQYYINTNPPPLRLRVC